MRHKKGYASNSLPSEYPTEKSSCYDSSLISLEISISTFNNISASYDFSKHGMQFAIGKIINSIN
jgi:hypothetical protein